MGPHAGQIVILNGAPRSGKSSIAAAIQDSFDGVWMNLGTDTFILSVTPPRYRPGVGLRPDGERQDIEPLVPVLFAAMYESVAAHSRLGLNVVVDVAHHDGYAVSRGILSDVARRLAGLPVLLVGVRCPIEVIMQRRDAGQPGRENAYATSNPDGSIPEPVLRWQREVHIPGIYDFEVDTAVMTPEQCAGAIRRRLTDGVPANAMQRLAVL